MEIPLTALSTLTGVLVMFVAWFFVGARLKQSQLVIPHQITLLHSFFLHMGLFFAIMALPHLWLYIDATQFPLLMAWGYTIGHIFLYIAFIYIVRMTVSLIPALAGREQLSIILGTTLTIAVTLLTAVTMIFGTQPVYDFERHITQFNASPLVGAAIGILATISFLPPAILFLINAAKSRSGHRQRALLLGVGFILMMIAGPLHDVAQNWQTFVIADIFTIVSIILVGAGILYRLEVSLSLEQPSKAERSPSR